MPKLYLSDAEATLLLEELARLGDELGYKGCNDYDLKEVMPSLAERNAFVADFHRYNGCCDGTDLACYPPPAPHKSRGSWKVRLPIA